MMTQQQEMQVPAQTAPATSNELHELTVDELCQVSGGIYQDDGTIGGTIWAYGPAGRP